MHTIILIIYLLVCYDIRGKHSTIFFNLTVNQNTKLFYSIRPSRA